MACLRSCVALASALVAFGCEVGDGPRDEFAIVDGSVEAGTLGEDEDLDGLCDATEAEFGSSPHEVDTDADGLPDFLELIYGFIATDPSSPDPDQIGYMAAQLGAEARFDIRLSGSGNGSDFIGFFEDLASPYGDGISAGTYFVAGEAVGAEPPEAVRVIEGPAQRFRSVLGTVRLELFALFRAGEFVDPEGCGRAYPFRYRVKDDLGKLIDERLYLLVVAAPGFDTAVDFCTPAPCI